MQHKLEEAKSGMFASVLFSSFPEGSEKYMKSFITNCFVKQIYCYLNEYIVSVVMDKQKLNILVTFHSFTLDGCGLIGSIIINFKYKKRHCKCYIVINR